MTAADTLAPRPPNGRLAGLLYLIVIVGALFGEAFVRGRLIVSGDPDGTARNIIENEALYRAGLGVALVYLACNIPIIWTFARAFAAKNRDLAFLMTLLFMTAIGVEIVNLANLYQPVQLLLADSVAAGPEEAERAWLAYQALRTFSAVFAVSLVFFGLYCFVLGTLIITSRLVPRLIGVLIILGGAGYLVNSFALLLAPDLARALFPYVLLPAFVAELSLALWLLAAGFSQKHWGGGEL